MMISSNPHISINIVKHSHGFCWSLSYVEFHPLSSRHARQNHRNGIKKTRRPRKMSMAGMNCRFVRNQAFANRGMSKLTAEAPSVFVLVGWWAPGKPLLSCCK